ncbi:MAG: 3'-5' exonuclease [Thiotrichaceae bacterium]
MSVDFDSLVAIDVETSGLNPLKNQILSVSLVPFDNSVEPLDIFISHEALVWNETAKKYFKKYKNNWSKKAVTPSKAYELISSYAHQFHRKPIVLVGHNVGFDYSFLKQLAYLAGQDEFEEISHRTIDTHSALYMLYLSGLIEDRALTSSGAFKHFNISIPSLERHTARADAVATKELFIQIIDLMTEKLSDQGSKLIAL